MRKLLTISLILITVCLQAQTWQRIDKNKYEFELKRAEEFFKSPSYSFNITYQSFIGHASSVVYDEMKGTYIRSGDSFYSDLPGQLSFQEGNIRAMVDTVDRRIILLDPDINRDHSLDQITYDLTLKYAEKIEVKKSNTGQTIRMVYPKDYKIQQYQIEMDEQGLITSIGIYYLEKALVNPDNEEGPEDHLKLLIKLSDYKKKVSIPDHYKMNKVLNKNGNIYLAIGEFKGYQVNDYRTK